MKPKTNLALVCGQLHAAPQHLAIIMDGNQRWARTKSRPPTYGHRAGAKNVHKVTECCIEAGISHLTLFAFSTENWQRPSDEISLLMRLMKHMLEQDIQQLHEANIRLRIIGDRTRFSDEMQKLMVTAEKRTENNKRMYLQLAVSYGGRWDMKTAMKGIARALARGDITESDIDEDLIESFTSLQGLPPVDLCIRTGGDQRVSNFLLWDLAYTELYFTPTYWPDFDDSTLADALLFFSSRERRYGEH